MRGFIPEEWSWHFIDDKIVVRMHSPQKESGKLA